VNYISSLAMEDWAYGAVRMSEINQT